MDPYEEHKEAEAKSKKQIVNNSACFHDKECSNIN